MEKPSPKMYSMKDLMAQFLEELPVLAKLDEISGYPREHEALSRIPLQFQDICEVEPELVEVEKDAAAVGELLRHASGEEVNDCWYGRGQYKNSGFRQRIYDLAGDGARVPALRKTEYWDIVHRHILDLVMYPDGRPAEVEE